MFHFDSFVGVSFGSEHIIAFLYHLIQRIAFFYSIFRFNLMNYSNFKFSLCKYPHNSVETEEQHYFACNLERGQKLHQNHRNEEENKKSILHSVVRIPTVLGRNRYIYGLSRHDADISTVLISSGLSSVIFKYGPMYAFDGDSLSLTNCTIPSNN